jgi:hypothetical protein
MDDIYISSIKDKNPTFENGSQITISPFTHSDLDFRQSNIEDIKADTTREGLKV